MSAPCIRLAVALTGILCAIGALAAYARAANPDRIQQGHAVFLHTCAPCHGFGAGDDGRLLLPAPTALSLKYKGAISPYLEERSDLPFPVLLNYVRHGSWSMPAFRKTEVTDEEVRSIADYLAESSKKANR